MFLDKKQLAYKYGVGVRTIENRIKEMKESGNYRGAFKKPGRALTVDEVYFDNYLIERANREVKQ